MDAADLSPSSETENQKQARLRRERRNAKIQAGGSDRLTKITSLAGRPAASEGDVPLATSPRPVPQTRPEPSPPFSAQAPIAPAAQASRGALSDDPDEVDISNMFQRDPSEMSPHDQQALLRQMLGSAGPQQNQDFGQDGIPNSDDPMMAMMQQMLGGGGPGGGGLGAGGNLPPGLSGLFGGQAPAPSTSSVDYAWRVVHAIFALGLGFYTAFKLPFTGAESARSAFEQDPQGLRVFWIFATTELVLQSSRYVLDKGQLPPTGILGTIGQMLPPPYAGYLRTLGRYMIIWTTIVSDAMVIVFILGCTAWWKGLAAS